MAASASASTARNHPFRLEVQDVTPVSASILWSLRPPPLSAIPRNFLRQQKQQTLQHHQATLSNGSSASSSSTAPRAPVIRLANESGVTATRSVNRKVTKVTVRNISPNKRNRLVKQSQNPSQGVDSEDWPSDDGATAVDEDETRDEEELDQERTLDDYSTRLHPDDYSEASDDGNASAKIFDSGVSVSVNGVPWSQVVMGDRGTDEAFIVVYGLLPSRDYELLLSVEGKQQQHSTAIALSTTAPEREEKSTSSFAIPVVASDQSRAISVTTTPPAQAVNRLRTHTPPMQDTDAGPLEAPVEQVGALMNAANTLPTNSTAVLSASAIQASLRRARKDASRAESALRSEIEAIKRGLERMSDVDHRSKQKVLALQESIRQATLHAKDIDEEATAVESERGAWEEREREKDEELSKVKGAVEEDLRRGDAKIKVDDEEVEAMEKELQKVTKGLEEKWSSKEKLEREKVAEIELELQKVQVEIEELLRPTSIHQQPNYAHYYNAAPAHGQTTTSFVPTQLINRGKGKGVARGGNRSTSNPTATGAHRRNQNRQRTQGQPAHSNTSDEPLHDFHGSSSSSTHGSILNPNNPEFVPASASPVVTKSSMLPHSEYSPSTNSRFAFASTPFYNNLEQETERRSSLGHIGLSPRANPLSANPTSATTPWSTNPTASSTLPWVNKTTASPTLSHDIWGATTTGSSSTATSVASPSSALHTKTSIPFGLNASLLRGGTTAQSPSFAATSRVEDGSLASFRHGPFGVEASNSRSGSAPVSPTYPSKSFASMMATGHSPQPEE